MGITSWFTRKRTPQIESVCKSEPALSEKEVFGSPILLASWAKGQLLDAFSLEDDYRCVPDEQTRTNLNITPAQRERCVRECSLLRVAGIALFVKQHYSDDFWLVFLKSVAPYVCQHMYGSVDDGRVAEVAEAIEEYVEASVSNDADRRAKAYLRRVYDDSDHFYSLALGGVGVASTQIIGDLCEAFREIHAKITGQVAQSGAIES